MRKRLLIISHVLPFPGSSGQQQRVLNTIRALTAELDVDFLTSAPRSKHAEIAAGLERLGCSPIILESPRVTSRFGRAVQSAAAASYALRTGLKRSNYHIGVRELSPERIASAVDPRRYVAVLYEYFHAVDSVDLFKAAGVPTVLDMHNVLWKSYEQRATERRLPPALRELVVSRYRTREYAAWARFDALVTINRREDQLVRAQARGGQHVFFAPMGADLARWSAPWEPATPPRLVYYGGLGSRHNEAAALQCHDIIMPEVWRTVPDAELWLVGSKPSERLRALAADPRVKVTGFVEDAADVLRRMSLVVCPWSGTYGFRSRIVELMAVGLPIVTTPDAVDGMDLASGDGVELVSSVEKMASAALGLLRDPARLAQQSATARERMQQLYSFETTYVRFVRELRDWLRQFPSGS